MMLKMEKKVHLNKLMVVRMLLMVVNIFQKVILEMVMDAHMNITKKTLVMKTMRGKKKVKERLEKWLMHLMLKKVIHFHYGIIFWSCPSLCQSMSILLLQAYQRRVLFSMAIIIFIFFLGCIKNLPSLIS